MHISANAPLLLVNYNAVIDDDDVGGGASDNWKNLNKNNHDHRCFLFVELIVIIFIIIVILMLCAVSDVRGRLLDCEQWAPDSPHAQ